LIDRQIKNLIFIFVRFLCLIFIKSVERPKLVYNKDEDEIHKKINNKKKRKTKNITVNNKKIVNENNNNP
jgi:hypothetical protein